MLPPSGYCGFCFIAAIKIMNIVHMKGKNRGKVKDMAKLNNPVRGNRFRMSALLGILFLIIGISLLVYSISAINNSEQLSSSTDLTLEQMWHYDGSLLWWRNACITLFLPLTAVFVTLGGIVLVTQPLLTRLRHKSVL
jgi:hypothetical protein